MTSNVPFPPAPHPAAAGRGGYSRGAGSIRTLGLDPRSPAPGRVKQVSPGRRHGTSGPRPRTILLLELPDLAGVEVDFKNGLAQRQNGTGPLLVLAGGGQLLSGHVVDARRAAKRRRDDVVLVQPGQGANLPGGRIGGGKKHDLGPLLLETQPLLVPVDVEADLNADRSKVGLEID